MAILFGREQLPYVLALMLFGALAGSVYDLFKIKRRIFFTPAPLLFFDDLLFCLISACGMICTVFAFNNGNLKWYEIPLFAFGFAVYRKTVSKVFIGIVFWCIDLVERLIKWVLCPVRKFVRFVGYFFVNIAEQALLRFYTYCNRKRFSRFMLKI